MSVSLITGIGEKVSPSRLTTPRGWCCMCVLCVLVCALLFARVHVFLSAYHSVCLRDTYSYLRSSVKRCVCVCVVAKGASARPGAEIDSLAKERK